MSRILTEIVNVEETDTADTGVFKTYTRVLAKYRASTPDYRGKIARGEVLPTNPYAVLSSTRNETKGPLNKSGQTASFTGVGGSGRTVCYGNVEEMKAEAIAKATEGVYANIKEGEFNLAVSGAELPKALTMVGATATRLATTMRHLKRFDIPSAFQALGAGSGPHYRSLIRRSNSTRKQAIRTGNVTRAGREFAASTWLEIKYGWKPLLNDTYNASESMARMMSDNSSSDVRTLGTGSSRSPYKFVSSSSLKGFASGERKVSARYVIYSRISNPSLRTAAGLGLTNPAIFAWELLPFSFVVDWFVPVGDVLNSLDATMGLNFVDGTLTLKTTDKFQAGITQIENFNWSTWTWDKVSGGQSVRSKSFYLEREPLITYPPYPSLPTVSKGLKEALGVNKTITALALLSNVFK
jgi:hypothetical protein